MPEETRSEYTEGIFEDVNATSLEEVFEQQADNVEILKNDIEAYIKELEKGVGIDIAQGVYSVENLEEIEQALYRKAFMDCVEAIKDKALNFLITEAVKSAVATHEYNYDLYVNHLLSAMKDNKEKLIAIIPHEEEKTVEVKVNLNSLGKPEEWGKAIEAYRRKRNLGKVSKRNKEIGSKIWREKIYGVGREGGQVKRFYKKRDSSIDVTDKYKNLYRETVEGRLRNLPTNKAPFWYLIEHGNAQGGEKLKLDTDGVPYPRFGPTNFVRNSEEVIASAFAQVWEQYYQAAIQLFREIVRDSYAKKRAARRPVSRVSEEERAANERMWRRIRDSKRKEVRVVSTLREEVRETIESGEELALGGKIQAVVETANGRYEAYIQGETIRISLRDPLSGRYIKLPWKNLDEEIETWLK